MSKHGIEGLTKAMAIDLAPYRIRVNTIGPTFIDTPLTRPFWNDKVFHDPGMIATSIRCVAPVCFILAVAILASGLRAYRAATADLVTTPART